MSSNKSWPCNHFDEEWWWESGEECFLCKAANAKKEQILESLSNYKERLTKDLKYGEAFAVGMCIQIIKEEQEHMSEPQTAIEALWDALWPGPGHNPYPLNKDKETE